MTHAFLYSQQSARQKDALLSFVVEQRLLPTRECRTPAETIRE